MALVLASPSIGTAPHLRRCHKSRPGGRSSLSKPGWSCREADLKRLVGDEASSLERLTVKSRVVVPNTAGVHGRVRRLAVAFNGSSVSFEPAQKQVSVRSEWASRGVVQVIHAVGVSLMLWMGDRSHAVVWPVPVRRTR